MIYLHTTKWVVGGSSDLAGSGFAMSGVGPPESGLTHSESKWRPPVEENPTRICESRAGVVCVGG